MMSHEFNQLDEAGRIHALFEKGVYLATRETTEFEILLYQIEGFYVEVYFDIDRDVIHKLLGFENLNQLRPYLVKIDIDGLK